MMTNGVYSLLHISLWQQAQRLDPIDNYSILMEAERISFYLFGMDSAIETIFMIV
jgi:hypothetical protein